MNQIIIFNEKHIDRIFTWETEEDLDKIFFKIFKERVEDNWYHELDINLDVLVTEENYKEVRRIMQRRTNYEYEYFESSKLEEYK